MEPERRKSCRKRKQRVIHPTAVVPDEEPRRKRKKKEKPVDDPVSGPGKDDKQSETKSNPADVEGSPEDDNKQGRLDPEEAVDLGKAPATSGIVLENGKFLNFRELFRKLQTEATVLSALPDIVKTNTLYVVSAGENGSYPEDNFAGSWVCRGTTKRVFRLDSVSGDMHYLDTRGSRFVAPAGGRKELRQVMTPRGIELRQSVVHEFMDQGPPENELLKFKEWLFISKTDKTFKKKILRIHQTPVAKELLNFWVIQYKGGDGCGEEKVEPHDVPVPYEVNCELPPPEVQRQSPHDLTEGKPFGHVMNDSYVYQDAEGDCGIHLKEGRFLSFKELYAILQNIGPPLPHLPKDVQGGRLYVVRKSPEGFSKYPDSCGDWSSRCTTRRIFWLNNSMQYVEHVKGQYVIVDRDVKPTQGIKQPRTLKVLDPQPSEDQLIKFKERLFALKVDKTFQKKIIYFEQAPPICKQFLDLVAIQYKGQRNNVIEVQNCEHSKPQEMVEGDENFEGLMNLEVEINEDNSGDTNQGIPLPDPGRFLHFKEVFEVMKSWSPALPSLPETIMGNRLYVVDNGGNVLRDADNYRQAFPDNCGPWICRGSTQRVYWVTDSEGSMQYIERFGDKYAVIETKSEMDGVTGKMKRVRLREVLDPQPPDEELLKFKEWVFVNKDNGRFQKKIICILQSPLHKRLLDVVAIQYKGFNPEEEAISHSSSLYLDQSWCAGSRDVSEQMCLPNGVVDASSGEEDERNTDLQMWMDFTTLYSKLQVHTDCKCCARQRI